MNPNLLLLGILSLFSVAVWGAQIDNIQKTFPNGSYKLIPTSSRTAKACPPSGRFLWNSEGTAGWVFRISAGFNLALPRRAFQGSGPKPGRYNSPSSPCQLFKTYKWSVREKRFFIQEDYRCAEKKLERSYQVVFQRRDNRVWITQSQTKGIELKGKKRETLLQCAYEVRGKKS